MSTVSYVNFETWEAAAEGALLGLGINSGRFRYHALTKSYHKVCFNFCCACICAAGWVAAVVSSFRPTLLPKVERNIWSKIIQTVSAPASNKIDRQCQHWDDRPIENIQHSIDGTYWIRNCPVLRDRIWTKLGQIFLATRKVVLLLQVPRRRYPNGYGKRDVQAWFGGRCATSRHLWPQIYMLIPLLPIT